MSLSINDVRHIASLARLHFTDDEEHRLAEQMNGILDYMAKLNELDTADVPPMSHVLDLFNVVRDDVVMERITTEEALANAPDADGAYFRVPRIID